MKLCFVTANNQVILYLIKKPTLAWLVGKLNYYLHSGRQDISQLAFPF